MTQVLSGLENQLPIFMLSPSGSNVPLNQSAVLYSEANLPQLSEELFCTFEVAKVII